MLKKAIEDLKEHIMANGLKVYEADIATMSRLGPINLSFTTTAFNKMNISGLKYKDAPMQLKRYYESEAELCKVPTEKVIEYLADIMDECWVRSHV